MLKLVRWRIVDDELLIEVELIDPDFSFEAAGDRLGGEVKKLLKGIGANIKYSTVKVFLQGTLLTAMSVAPMFSQETPNQLHLNTSQVAEVVGVDDLEAQVSLPQIEIGPKREYKRMNLVLIAGHHSLDGDPGAVSNGRYESQYASDLVARVEQVLKSKSEININIIKEPTPMALTSEMTFLRSTGADYALSIHFNAGGGSGTEIIVPHQASDLSIAQGIIDNFKSLGQPIRPTPLYSRSSSGKMARKDGVAVEAKRDYYGIIRAGSEVNIHSDILEVEFIDNQANMDFYDAHVDDFATAIAASIEMHYANNYIVIK